MADHSGVLISNIHAHFMIIQIVYLMLVSFNFSCYLFCCVLEEEAVKFLQKIAKQLQLPCKIFRVCPIHFSVCSLASFHCSFSDISDIDKCCLNLFSVGL